jgi:hypothetical protein
MYEGKAAGEGLIHPPTRDLFFTFQFHCTTHKDAVNDFFPQCRTFDFVLASMSVCAFIAFLFLLSVMN